VQPDADPDPDADLTPRQARLVAAYLRTGSVAEAARQASYTRSHASRLLNGALAERVAESMQRVGLTLDAPLIAVRDALHAERPVISTQTGEIIATVADHGTRVAAARTLLQFLAKLDRPDDEEKVAPQPSARLLTEEELRAMTRGDQQRVIMEQRRVIIEPADA
jgi:hypothetical protein